MLRNGLVAKRELLSATVDYETTSESGTVETARKNVTVDVELTTTNLTTGTYRDVESVSVAEPVPVGLAGYLYAALNVLHYDGNFSLLEQECAGRVAPGDLINFTGALAAYSTMDAVAQSVVENLEAGVTSVTVGPPKHLGKDDIIEFLQANRNRIRYTAPGVMSSGNSFSATPVSLGKETPVKNTNAENGSLDLFTVAKWVVIDPTDFPVQAAAGNAPWGGTIRIRELPICDDTNEDLGPRKRWIKILCSEIYDKPQT